MTEICCCVNLLMTRCTVVTFAVVCVGVWFREVRFVSGKCMKNFWAKFLFLVSCCVVYCVLYTIRVSALAKCKSVSRTEDIFSHAVLAKVAVDYF